MQVTEVQSLGLEGPLGQERATRSSTLAWGSYRQRSVVQGVTKELDMTYRLTITIMINCLELSLIFVWIIVLSPYNFTEI